MDFMRNFHCAVEKALESDVDFIIHAGDLFDRSKPPVKLKEQVFDSLYRLAQVKPVFLIPGNHDRSVLPLGLFEHLSQLYVFNKPRTLEFYCRDVRVSVSGFPYTRHIAKVFTSVLKPPKQSPDYRILVMHQLVEGARAGIQNYVFRSTRPDVLPLNTIPKWMDYVALGHVHKHQCLREHPQPVVYSGSTERTAMTEREEVKGFVEVDVYFDNSSKSKPITKWLFHPLWSRPLTYEKVRSLNSISELNRLLESWNVEEGAIVRCAVEEEPSPQFWKDLRDRKTKILELWNIKQLDIYSRAPNVS